MLYLLERICAPMRDSQGREEALDEVSAALAQVQRIAATVRQVGGSVAAVPWGLGAVPAMGAISAVELGAYAQRLAEAITRHEPRLKDVRVGLDHRDDPLSPYGLLVTAVFPGEDLPREVRIPGPR